MCSSNYCIFTHGIRHHGSASDKCSWTQGRAKKILQEKKLSSLAESGHDVPTLTFPAFSNSSNQVADARDVASQAEGMRIFEKVDTRFTDEVARIVESIADLINLVRGEEHCAAVFTDEEYSTISQAVKLVQFDATQQVSLFDFFREYMLFLDCSRLTVEELQSLLDDQNFHSTGSESNEVDSGANEKSEMVINQWANWVLPRFAPSLRRDILNGQVRDPGVVLLIKTVEERRIAVRLQGRTTIAELKSMMFRLDGWQPELQCLVSRGKRLQDHWTVGQSNLTTEHHVHLLLPGI